LRYGTNKKENIKKEGGKERLPEEDRHPEMREHKPQEGAGYEHRGGKH